MLSRTAQKGKSLLPTLILKRIVWRICAANCSCAQCSEEARGTPTLQIISTQEEIPALRKSGFCQTSVCNGHASLLEKHLYQIAMSRDHNHFADLAEKSNLPCPRRCWRGDASLPSVLKGNYKFLLLAIAQVSLCQNYVTQSLVYYKPFNQDSLNQDISMVANLAQLYLMTVKLLNRDIVIQWHRELSISTLLNQREMPNFTSITNRDSSNNKEINANEKWNAVNNLLTAVVLLWWVLYVMASLFRSIFVSPYQDGCLIELAFDQFRVSYWINMQICLALADQVCGCGVPAGLSVGKTKLICWRV